MKPASIALLLFLAALPVLAAPGAFTVSGSGQCNGPTPHIVLAWSASSGATTYDVYRNSQNIVTVTSGTGFDDTGVAPGSTYSYFVRATDGSSTTDSNTVVVMAPNCSPPPGPFVLSGNAFCYNAPPKRAAIHLSWPASSNATSYDVYRDGGLFTSTPTGGSYSVDDISPGLSGHHSYYVIARNAAGTTQSNTVDVTIPPDVCQDPPGSFTLDGSAVCDTTGPRVNVNLSWTPATAAAGYQIIRNNTPLTSTTGTNYTDTTANPGQTYNYKITATNSGGSTDSNTKSINIPNEICPPPAPIVSANATCVAGPPAAPAVHVSWSTVPFATSYVVRRGGSPISGALSASTTTFDDVNVTAGQTYSYTVTASNSTGSATSAAAQATVANLPCIPNPPGAFSASATGSCEAGVPVAHVSWTTSSGATSYTVYRNGNSVSPPLSSSTAIFHDNTVMSGQSYTYSVTASNDGGSTTSSSAGVTLPNCNSSPPPTAFTASVSAFCNAGSPAVHVTWSTGNGATSWVVDRNGSPISGTLTTDFYNDTTVTAGLSYTYSVVASNSGGNTTASAGTIVPSTAACPPPAFSMSAMATCNPIVSPPAAMVTLNWSAAATATSYLILRNGTQVGSVGGSTTTFNDSVAAAGTYTYVVRAVGPGGNTDSNAVTLTVDANLCSTPKPDLAAVTVTIALPAGQPGDSMGAAFTVSNEGSVSAPATTSRLRIGSGATLSPSDPVVAVVATPSLAAGANTTQTTNFIVPSLPAGTYFLFLSVDEDHVSGDINPANDVKRSVGFAVQGSTCTLSCAANVASAAQAGTPVVFALQQAPACPNTSAVWNFGDNTSSTGLSPTHVYSATGTYHWTVTLTAANGQPCANSGTIAITAPTVPPKRRAVHH